MFGLSNLQIYDRLLVSGRVIALGLLLLYQNSTIDMVHGYCYDQNLMMLKFGLIF